MSANIAIKSELSVILPIFLAFFVRSPFKTLFCKTMPWLNLLFSGAFRKEVKETSTLTKPSPIWEGCSWKSRHAADFQSFGMALKPLPLWGSPCFLIPTTLNTRRSKGDDNTWRKRQKSERSSEIVLFWEFSSILVSRSETSKSTWDAVWAKRVHRIILKIAQSASELRTFLGLLPFSTNRNQPKNQSQANQIT